MREQLLDATSSANAMTTTTPRTARPQRRIVAAVAALLCVALVLHRQGAWSSPPPGNDLPLTERVDAAFSTALLAAGTAHHFTQCKGDQMRPFGEDDFRPAKAVFSDLGKLGEAPTAVGDQKFVEVLVKNVPCWGMDNCCEATTYLRSNGKDTSYFKEVFQTHSLRILYPLFANFTPKYVLDGGTGAGYTTQMLKQLHPFSTHVALEPEAAAFEALTINTREVDGVHAVHAALWWRRALLQLKTVKKSRKRPAAVVAEEIKLGRKAGKAPRVQGVRIADMLALYELPAWDLVYLDVEGAEGLLFGPHASTSWLQHVKCLVIKLHDPLAKSYGLQEVTAQVTAAVRWLPFTVVADATHIVLLAPEVAEPVRAELQQQGHWPSGEQEGG